MVVVLPMSDKHEKGNRSSRANIRINIIDT